jgi:hypothetical protein
LGEFFSSFEDAWTSFVTRQEPLESFYDQFPDDPDYVVSGWLLEPSAEVRAAALDLQARLAPVEWLDPTPEHFLHTWIGLDSRIGDAARAWAELPRFRATYERVNCFHTAVVLEVGGRFRELVAGTPNDVPTFLPHLTVAVVREPRPPGELQDLLIPLRDATFGEQDVDAVSLVSFPCGRTTVYQPWTLERRVTLGGSPAAR